MTHRNVDNICRLRNVPVNSLFVFRGRHDSVYLYCKKGKNGIGYGVKMSTRTLEEIPADYLDYWVIQIKDADFYYKDTCVARLFNNQFWVAPETPQLLRSDGHDVRHCPPANSLVLRDLNLIMMVGDIYHQIYGNQDWSRKDRWLEVEGEYYY